MQPRRKIHSIIGCLTETDTRHLDWVHESVKKSSECGHCIQLCIYLLRIFFLVLLFDFVKELHIIAIWVWNTRHDWNFLIDMQKCVLENENIKKFQLIGIPWNERKKCWKVRILWLRRMCYSNRIVEWTWHDLLKKHLLLPHILIHPYSFFSPNILAVELRQWG